MVVFDANEQSILSMENHNIVLMCVNGENDTYIPYQDEDGSWDMASVNDVNVVYGLNCVNISELRARLLADYAIGTISYFIIRR